MPRGSFGRILCSTPSLSSNPARDLTPTLHHHRSISYDDHSNCSHMPMLTKFMTCIFPPPSYFLFLFLFVCVTSIYSFIHLFHPPTQAYLISHSVLYSCLYPILAFHPHVSRATFLVIKFPASSRSDNSHSDFPFSPSHSTTLPPRARSWLLKTNGYILVTFCFLIRT
ncbi:hypothetical protein BGY98DRAFT_733320 [Russula aff. rugulosa BPL654]|nr:hypothetical protein BGY98DRAFT_733320 [Russula aff. rugulosa BPL654]